jgi:peptidyl-dipeptidase Dcp
LLSKTEIDAIITNSDVPTFENTIVALDFAGEQLDRLSSIFF